MGDIPQLLPEGKYRASLRRMDPPEIGKTGRAWFCRCIFVVNGSPIFHFIAGYPEGLRLLYSCRFELLARTWSVRVRHREYKPDGEDAQTILQTDLDWDV